MSVDSITSQISSRSESKATNDAKYMEECCEKISKIFADSKEDNVRIMYSQIDPKLSRIINERAQSQSPPWSFEVPDPVTTPLANFFYAINALNKSGKYHTVDWIFDVNEDEHTGICICSKPILERFNKNGKYNIETVRTYKRYGLSLPTFFNKAAVTIVR